MTMHAEFLVRDQETMEAALASLFEKLAAELADHPDRQWEWRRKPEAICRADGWVAYARIAYK